MKNPGIKVGDIVYLRQDLQIGSTYGCLVVYPDMRPLKYKGLEVLDINDAAVFLETDTGRWWYTFEMLDFETYEFPSKESLMDFLCGEEND